MHRVYRNPELYMYFGFYGIFKKAKLLNVHLMVLMRSVFLQALNKNKGILYNKIIFVSYWKKETIIPR